MLTGRLATILTLALCSLALSPARAQAEEPLRWTKTTESRRLATPVDGADQQLYALCGSGDLGLVQVATAVVSRRIEGAPPPSQEELKELTRAAGVAQVWPRAWLLDDASDGSLVTRRMSRWLAKTPVYGVRKCGIARGASADGKPVVAAVTVDAIAELKSLPRRTRTSRWLTVEAKMHRPAQGAKVVLLGPKGRPRRALTSLSSGRVRARFNLHQPGRWLVQVVATLDGGPRPILEAVVFAGVKPSSSLPTAAATPKMPATASKLLGLLNAGRAQEGLTALRRDKALTRVARAHAEAMIQSGRVAHNAGDGSPAARVQSAQVKAQRVGENVARAPTLRRVHQALWNSPSHRDNMLDSSFDRVGIAVVRCGQGKLWAVQLFAR
jgi:uncharacterized protein YkwD